MTSRPAVRVQGLTKRFGTFTAVNDLTFSVAEGEVLGFLGPNGSGKTTTMRMLTGSSRPTSGTVEVLGIDAVAHPRRIRPRIGYLSQKFSLFDDLTVAENLRLYAGIYDLPKDRAAERTDAILTMANLHGREQELTRNLSTGWKQRLALGVATLHTPDLLFLDEPTSGVDPVARRQLWDLLYELADTGITLFVTTHYMEEAANCTRLIFMERGRMIADGTPRQLRKTYASSAGRRAALPTLEDVFVQLAARPSGGAQ